MSTGFDTTADGARVAGAQAGVGVFVGQSGHVTATIRGRRMDLRLARPAKLNALTEPMLRDMIGALAAAEDAAAAVVVVWGEGSSFSAGADLEAWSGLASVADVERWIRLGHECFNRLAESPAVTIAALHGYVLGGGFELALATDIRIATEDTVLGLPEVGVGAVPGWGGSDRLLALAGAAWARRLALTGQQVSARDLAASGIVGAVVPSVALEGAVDEYCDRLLDVRPAVARAAKSLFAAAAVPPSGVQRDVDLAIALRELPA